MAHHFKILSQTLRDMSPAITCGTVSVTFLSCAVFGIQTYFDLPRGALSVGADVFASGHLHRLFTHPFYHRSLAQLLPNVVALLFLSGSLEKGVGTVRFLLLFLSLSTSTGLLYAFLDLLQYNGSQSHAEGLLPAALACLTLTTTHTKMTKGFLCGVSFPTVALPWVLVIVTTALIPNTVLPCNIIATLIGWLHGKGWFHLLDISETRAGVLERTLPFRALRRISTVIFVPASTEERRKTLLPQINPTSGSYPVQTYAPLSSVTPANAPNTHEGWRDSVDSVPSLTPPPRPHGHGPARSFGTTHGHCPDKSFGQSCNHSELTEGHGHL